MSQFIGCADADGACASSARRAAVDTARGVLPGPTRVDTRSPFALGASTPREHGPSLVSFAKTSGTNVWVSGYLGRVGSDLVPDPAAHLLRWLAEGHDLDEFLRGHDGHFSTVVVEPEAQRVRIATDRLGSVPVFVHHRGRSLAWSTRFSAMRHLPGVDARLDVGALESFLRLGSSSARRPTTPVSSRCPQPPWRCTTWGPGSPPAIATGRGARRNCSTSMRVRRWRGSASCGSAPSGD